MSGAGDEAPGGRQVSQAVPPSGRGDQVRPLSAAHGAVKAGGCPSGQCEGAQRIRGANQSGIVASSRKGIESAEEKKVLGVCAVVSIGSEALGSLNDDGGREVEIVVGGD